MKYATYRVVIDRENWMHQDVAVPIINDHKIVLVFQAPLGTEPKVYPLERLEDAEDTKKEQKQICR